MAKSSSLVANYLYLRGMLRAACGENLEVGETESIRKCGQISFCVFFLFCLTVLELLVLLLFPSNRQ